MTISLKDITDADSFNAVADAIKALPNYPGDPAAFSLGIATVVNDEILDVRFLHTNVDGNYRSAALFWWASQYSDASLPSEIDEAQLTLLSEAFSVLTVDDAHPHHNKVAVERLLEDGMGIEPILSETGHRFAIVLAWDQDFAAKATTREQYWLRITLLSETKKVPNSINLDGIMSALPILLWTDVGPVVPEYSMTEMFLNDFGVVTSIGLIDRLPRMIDYVLPQKGVRIVDPANVRLGAHLAEGTTVMPAGSINFNAGTLGPCMVEARIPIGVTVGGGSDLGGGASILGTASGGNTVVVSIGNDCLLEAMCGLGIPIDNRVRIEAGLYIKGTTPVFIGKRSGWTEGNVALSVMDIVHDKWPAGWVPAILLSGISDAVFRRNAFSSHVEVIPRGNSIWGTLNAELHQV